METQFVAVTAVWDAILGKRDALGVTRSMIMMMGGKRDSWRLDEVYFLCIMMLLGTRKALHSNPDIVLCGKVSGILMASPIGRQDKKKKHNSIILSSS